jgi:hypothetical protein
VSAGVVVFLRGADWEARWLAASAALSAAALGAPVKLALFGAALRALLEGRFDEGAPPQAAALGAAGLAAAIEEARGALGLRLVACDTAVRLEGLDPAVALGALDEIVSLPALVREARDGTALSF